MGALLQEHDEDLARLGGYLRDAGAARLASQEPILQRFLPRLPWLLMGLAGALLAARLMGAFEAQLQQEVVLAFFVPSIVYLADALGAQTEILVIRGFSVGVPLAGMVRRELVTGLLVGAVLAASFVPVGVLLWNRIDLIAAVALALFAACAMATMVAKALPAVLRRLGADPAFGSGPLATLLQDLLSILIYFVVASRVL